ncbi:MAG: hypothetical protein AUH46_05735 [Gemmatimonadetes bacterium 13_1_40CM_70_15]|nr:MAG: hypothetical protein AUH46_05735 [Gemmatimonadetes bacterium 13_1_40CM_70_15]
MRAMANRVVSTRVVWDRRSRKHATPAASAAVSTTAIPTTWLANRYPASLRTYSTMFAAPACAAEAANATGVFTPSQRT